MNNCISCNDYSRFNYLHTLCKIFKMYSQIGTSDYIKTKKLIHLSIYSIAIYVMKHKINLF